MVIPRRYATSCIAQVAVELRPKLAWNRCSDGLGISDRLTVEYAVDRSGEHVLDMLGFSLLINAINVSHINSAVFLRFIFV